MKRARHSDGHVPDERCSASGKVGYTSDRDVRQAMRRMREQGHGKVAPYRCSSCGRLHLGH